MIWKCPPNELRIDAAEEEKINVTFPRAAASIRVELSRAQENPDPLLLLIRLNRCGAFGQEIAVVCVP